MWLTRKMGGITFRNGMSFKKEKRKLSGNKMIFVARLGKLSAGLSMASGLVNKAGNSNQVLGALQT